MVQVCGIIEFTLILRDTLVTEACSACPYRDVTDLYCCSVCNGDVELN